MTGAMRESRNYAMAVASERFLGLLLIKMSSFVGFHHYAGDREGKPYAWRVAVEKQFMGRRPAGSKTPGSYGTGGRTV